MRAWGHEGDPLDCQEAASRSCVAWSVAPSFHREGESVAVLCSFSHPILLRLSRPASCPQVSSSPSSRLYSLLPRRTYCGLPSAWCCQFLPLTRSSAGVGIAGAEMKPPPPLPAPSSETPLLSGAPPAKTCSRSYGRVTCFAQLPGI